MSDLHPTATPTATDPGYSVDSRLTRFAPPPADVAAVVAAPVAPQPITAGNAADLLAPTGTPVAPRSAPPLGFGEGLRALLGSIGITLAPGAAERARLDSESHLRRDEDAIRRATWPRAVSILVANPKGGAGKTPIALLLGGALASVRGGSVCVVEVSDDPGALTLRSEGAPMAGLGQLVTDVATIRSAGQLAGYTAPQTSFASVIGTVGTRPPLTRDDVVSVARTIDEYYSVRVMDSGNQISSSAFAGALETADALVIPVLNAGDSVIEAIAFLDRLRSNGGASAELAARAVILRLSDGRREDPRVTDRLDRILEGAGAAHIFDIPFDDHIAERGQLTLGQLNRDTYRVLAAAAAAVVGTLGGVRAES